MMLDLNLKKTEKWRAFLFDMTRFAWAMRPGFLTGKVDHPWVYFRQWKEWFLWEQGCRGIKSSIGYPMLLRVSTVFPRLASLMLGRCLKDWPILFQDNRPLNTDAIGVSFIIPHRGRKRLPLLLTTLKSLAAQKEAAIECIVVEQSSKPEIKSDLPHWVCHVHTPIGKPDQPFNRSWALNVGARHAKGRVLVLHDGDTCVPANYAEEVLTLHAQGYTVMKLTRYCFMLDGPSSRRVCEGLDFPGGCSVSFIMIHNQGRTLAVDRKTYAELGGHDESFVGWGGEDDEFAQRCSLVRRYPYCYIPIVHLYHPENEDKNRHQPRNLERLEALTKIPPVLRSAILKRKQSWKTRDKSIGTDD